MRQREKAAAIGNLTKTDLPPRLEGTKERQYKKEKKRQNKMRCGDKKETRSPCPPPSSFSLLLRAFVTSW
jgi:hypothetical protein